MDLGANSGLQTGTERAVTGRRAAVPQDEGTDSLTFKSKINGNVYVGGFVQS
jgi:hypothetical protein